MRVSDRAKCLAPFPQTEYKKVKSKLGPLYFIDFYKKIYYNIYRKLNKDIFKDRLQQS